MTVRFELNGLEELKRTLAELNSESATKVGMVATREAAKIVREAFIAAAPVGTEPTRKTRRKKNGEIVPYDYGRLRDNIRIKKGKASNRHQVKFGVGVGAAFWGLIQEFGSKNMAARPWMRPAFDSVAPKVVDEIARLVGLGITREAKRLQRKAKKQAKL
jgi:HK97 gp10 family phage protein